MNFMNSSNIDNRFQTKRENTSKSIKMGEEKKLLIKLRTVATEVVKEAPGKAHIDVVPNKVSSMGIEAKKTKRKRKSPLIPWKKPEGMPKRPLSAYNLFFQDRRKSIMLAASESSENLNEDSKQSHRKSSKKRSGVGFANLARTIGTEWRALEAEKKAPYELLAANDKDRYDKEMKVWRAKEKEEKSMRESDLTAKGSYDCIAALPQFASIAAARNGFVEGIRDKATDGSMPLTDKIAGVGGGEQSLDILPMQDHELRGLFNSSIYGNFNNNSYLMNSSSNQPSNLAAQKHHQDSGVYGFNNTSIKNQIGQASMMRENFPYIGSMGAAAQATQSGQYPNQSFITPGNINSHSLKRTPWSNYRNALNGENAMGTSIDLEPLPLPDQSQQKGLMAWSGQNGLLQMHAKDQHQERIAMASNGQYLQRLQAGGASLLSAGWEQQNNLWFDKNANATDVNDPIQAPLVGGNMNHLHTEIDTMAASGGNALNDEKTGNNNTQSFPSSSNDSNQDPWKPFGF